MIGARRVPGGTEGQRNDVIRSESETDHFDFAARGRFRPNNLKELVELNGVRIVVVQVGHGGSTPPRLCDAGEEARRGLSRNSEVDDLRPPAVELSRQKVGIQSDITLIAKGDWKGVGHSECNRVA